MHRLDAVGSRGQSSTVKIGYIGGGSRGWAHTLINDLLQCENITGDVALYDVDYEAAAQNAELGNRLAAEDRVTANWTFNAHRKLDDTLADADFVMCSIQDPPEETFAHDIDVPQEYGIYQTVADTVGPGGTIRALRAIPQYREIAATVREQCPDAWVLTFTNPMTVCTRTLYEEFPDINAIGLCHEVFFTQRLLADITEKYVNDAEEVSPDEINVNVKGVNHFTWIDEAAWRDHDVFQYLDAELEERKPIPGFEPGDLADEYHSTNHYQVAFDLYDQFNLLGAAGDRHLVEFVPWYLNINDSEEIERWGIRLTPSSHRIGHGKEEDERMQRYLNGEERFEFEESVEEVVEIVRALSGIEPLKTHLNYPNIGQISNLPEGAVVETNALITGRGVTPLTAGELPEQVRTMVDRTVQNQETIVEAGFAGDLDLAFQAFLNEPLVTLQRDEAADLFAELVDIQRDYFTAYNLEGAAVLNS